MITYQTEGVDMPDIQKRETTAWIKAVAASYGKIITFDYCEGNRLSGDLFISLDTVRTNADQFAGGDYRRELHRVIIHGILHLCGINDKGPGEREIMEEAENKALGLITI